MLVTYQQIRYFLLNHLGSLDFNEGELLQIIRALNINNKANGHDDISIRMIKKSFLKPLTLS